MDVPTARSMARASWGDVQKTRASLHAQVTDVRKERGNATYMAMFDGIEQKLSQLRLACMQVIFHDFEYAADKKAEHTLWQAHTSVNSEYRRVVGRLCGQSQVVQKRKLERMYKDFLKTSQSFYCGYIQRLASRFFIPELCQAAQRLNVQPTDMPSRDASVPDPVRKLVTSSCQRSLVHLGDLSRYRCQISDKSTKTSFDTALAYYGLANSVDPDNGSAHHQMAVLYQLHAQHFEIVYHFHRAIAIAKPHELGLGNLEREYRGLQHPTPAAQAGAPADAMVSWFVRLHGFYFHGEPFSQQAELETEVLHRSEQAYKAQNPNHVLLRMALINIAAYEIATSKVKESWTLTASRTCQFLLRWTIRSIALLLRLVKAEFLDSRATLPTSVISTGSDESPMSSSALFTSHLALLRMYIAWIYTVRSDIVEYRAFLEPHASDVYRLLADSLTLFNEYVDQFSDTLKSAYLLPEDVEAIGLRPLEDRRLPLFFHVLEESDTRTYKKFKVRKQRKEELGANHSVQTETVWRIRDIVYCGILLAGSTHFPVSITAIQRPDGRTTEGWVFTDENPAASYITEIEMSRMLRRLELPNSKIIHDQQGTRPVQTQSATRALTPTNAVSPGTLLSDKQIAAHPTNDATHSERISAQPNANKATSAVGDSELNQDSEMLDMVNKLLDPADDGSSKHSSAFHESSYGMNTSTANDIFGHIGHSSDQPSPVAKQIPNLPWEYFYNASWNEPSTQARGQAIIDRSYVPRSSVGSRDDMRESLGGVTGQVPGVGVRNDRRSAFDKVATA
ncbi:uncharacterized protein B0I36DRAFT_379833 [Microdochium trichocladiopsis]|uniref:Protein SMG7 n=1 Tax=Microdochium trichocladiopsis TaxID=1682393 RepID=A0A9P8YL40_9PEZI|nr:uncharacterized protein B0I36DRAFT_379833 [Microdochium trichocladiopsis]KAH7040989.1 hypothetical protein B0I36DRAFT_379833 [Microdochium trichocladiopsis]